MVIGHYSFGLPYIKKGNLSIKNSKELVAKIIIDCIVAIESPFLG